MCSPVDDSIPERGAAHCKPDEPRHACGCRQPGFNATGFRTTTENYGPYMLPPVPPRGGGNLRTTVNPIQAFDLPHVRLDAGVLQLDYRTHHKPRTLGTIEKSSVTSK